MQCWPEFLPAVLSAPVQRGREKNKSKKLLDIAQCIVRPASNKQTVLILTWKDDWLIKKIKMQIFSLPEWKTKCIKRKMMMMRSNLWPGPWNRSLHGWSIIFNLRHGLRSCLTDISAPWGIINYPKCLLYVCSHIWFGLRVIKVWSFTGKSACLINHHLFKLHLCCLNSQSRP